MELNTSIIVTVFLIARRTLFRDAYAYDPPSGPLANHRWTRRGLLLHATGVSSYVIALVASVLVGLAAQQASGPPRYKSLRQKRETHSA